jgi:hypothetical protein
MKTLAFFLFVLFAPTQVSADVYIQAFGGGKPKPPAQEQK